MARAKSGCATLFEQAAKSAPSIIFIDEIDSIAPKRGQVSGEAEKRLVAQLLTLMDGIEPRQNLVVIAATNRPEAIDEALRRPGRFDREIVVGVPDETGRREILGIHTRGMPLADGVDLDELARRTYGFVGADLAALMREAALEAVRRIMPKINLEERRIPTEVLDALSVDQCRFRQCAEARPAVGDARSDGRRCPTSAGTMSAGSTRRATSCAKASSFRSSIPRRSGGSASARPRASCSMARRAPARPCSPRPPRARARPISSPPSRATCCSKWYGESEQQIARLFARARQVAPTVIFIDELDSLVPARGGGMGEPQVTERVVNTILAEMDGLEELNNVVLIGATNRPNLIDPALLRPGRFDELIYVGTARRRRAAADPGNPHQGDAAGQGCRPGGAGAADREFHRRRP